MGPVDGHFELVRRAQDLHLKRLTPDEGEMVQFPFLSAPLSFDEAVPDDHRLVVLVESRVEVEGEVVAFAQIHSELVSVAVDGSTDGDEEFVVDSLMQSFRVGNPQILLG